MRQYQSAGTTGLPSTTSVETETVPGRNFAASGHIGCPANRDAAIFEDDNARPHHSRVVIQQAGVDRLPWPAMSPDLNPTEHLWDDLGRRAKENHLPPASQHQLLNGLQEEWNNNVQASIARLVNFMRHCSR